MSLARKQRQESFGSITPGESQPVCCAVSSTLPGVVQAVEELNVWVDTKLFVTAAPA